MSEAEAYARILAHNRLLKPRRGGDQKWASEMVVKRKNRNKNKKK